MDQAWCGQCIFIVIMETGDLTGDFSFKTWKNRFLSQNLRFNLRFSKFMHFSKIHFILNLPLSWFLQKMIFHQYNLILHPWCNHDVKPNIMEHRYSLLKNDQYYKIHVCELMCHQHPTSKMPFYPFLATFVAVCWTSQYLGVFFKWVKMGTIRFYH